MQVERELKMREEVTMGPGPKEVGREHGLGALEKDTSSSEIGEKDECGQWGEKLLDFTIMVKIS